VSILAVVGAGPLGAATTHQASGMSIARRIVLIDDAADVARGLALDIRQAGPINGSSTAVEGTGDTGAVVGAGVIVIADRHGKGEWAGDEGLALVTRLRTLNPRALIICASAAQAGLVETFVHEKDGDRRRIVGSAPEALRSALTALACLESGAAPADVSLVAIGRPPKDMFVPWEGAAIGGSRAADVLPAAVLARLDRQMPYLWPPGPLALAGAAVRVARVVMGRAPGWVNAFLVPLVTDDRQVRGVAVPAVVDEGALRVVWPVLAPRDRVRLDSALAG
jgi:hypothetical protein